MVLYMWLTRWHPTRCYVKRLSSMTLDLIHPLMERFTADDFIEDYRIAYCSRQISLLGRQEVLSGRAKFGAFGDGKELANLAIARAFRPGDWRSGYYRDQTLMMALGEIDVARYFAQLYANTDPDAEPMTGGRQMPSHFVTRSLNADGTWRDLTAQINSSPDVSPTAAQMPRLVGLAYASRLYREIEALHAFTQFSKHGNEVAFGTIGNASTAEGLFWEAVNAIGVLRAPAVIVIYDDGYGISVENKHQMTKGDIGALLAGFQREGDGAGYDVYTAHGWDYAELVDTVGRAADNARTDHVPALIHVIECTQPQGHSTSGSHERYKSQERLDWEQAYDCVTRMRAWLIEQGYTTDADLTQLENEDRAAVRAEMDAAWKAFTGALDTERAEVRDLIEAVARESQHADALQRITRRLYQSSYPKRKEMHEAAFAALQATRDENIPARERLVEWRTRHKTDTERIYSTHLLSESAGSPLHVQAVTPVYADKPKMIPGSQILNQFFDAALTRDPRVIAFGEDVGYLGGVNQTMAGLQAKYGELRVSDTGIREITIVGQAIGMALRGLRPIAEIQYLDYLLYALQTLSDDLATLRWRSNGGQKAPAIISTRGHRLEGIWHAGSPLAGVINLVRGLHVCVPRDMTRAAGFYNTLLHGDDPGIVVEVLNGYRLREPQPENIAQIMIPLGVPEVLREGAHVTIVTYGALCSMALQAADRLAQVGVDTEVIDVQTLLPFDIRGRIGESLQKTNRIVFLDEDVPGGATAYMMQEVLERQGGYHWLDAEPRTLTAKAHRPAYGTDGGYFSKPNVEDIFEAVYGLMHDSNPNKYPLFYA